MPTQHTTPDAIEALAWNNPGSQIEMSGDTAILELHGTTWIAQVAA